MSQELGEQYGSTLVLTLVTGQMVTLDASHARIGTQWMSEVSGLMLLERVLGAGSGQETPAEPRCIVEVDDNGHPVRFFPTHAVVVARIDPYPLAE
ncbi:MAG TPA: hypothetical protein VFU32_07305 [Ktedonobacterales bacterium]|nr:hypothetical protein [Ktedonobacterales bacterium]